MIDNPPRESLTLGVFDAFFREAIEEPWLSTDGLTPGVAPPTLPTPDAYLCIEKDGVAFLRCDLYTNSEEYHFNNECHIQNQNIIFGFGEKAYIVDLQNKQMRDIIDLGSYFMTIQAINDPQPDSNSPSILIVSGDGIHCLDGQCELLWKRKDLGLDGVTLDRIDENRIFGQGDWDPPDGWRSFCLDLFSGVSSN